jgi:hypothetical protein
MILKDSTIITGCAGFPVVYATFHSLMMPPMLLHVLMELQVALVHGTLHHNAALLPIVFVAASLAILSFVMFLVSEATAVFTCYTTTKRV